MCTTLELIAEPSPMVCDEPVPDLPRRTSPAASVSDRDTVRGLRTGFGLPASALPASAVSVAMNASSAAKPSLVRSPFSNWRR